MLTTIHEGLYAKDHDHFMGPFHFRGRMTVVRLSGGSLLLHSPVPIDDALAKELEALGPVAHIVAPNQLHHVYLAACAARYPQARVYGARGLAEKRPDLRFDEVLGDEVPAALSADLAMVRVAGVPKVEEVVFFHRASKTLIVTDLVFNVVSCIGILSRVLFWLVGAYGKFVQSLSWRMLTKDRAAAGASVARILEWDFERVVMAHGEIVSGKDARERTANALQWMARGRPAPGAICDPSAGRRSLGGSPP